MTEKQYDPNLIINDKIGDVDVEFFDAESEPFRIYGMWREGDSFCRIPLEVSKNVSEGIVRKHVSTAGGRVRFVTDSPFVAIKVEYGDYHEKIDLSPYTATIGFDLYADGKYATTFRVPLDFDGELVSLRPLATRGEHLMTLNFPSHSEIKRIYIGLKPNAILKRAPDYTYEKPVVFYGSSITHGCCASRPGMTYENQISRALDMNYHNLGFGGLAKGEPTMAEYIAGLDMAAFVLDYDHNSTKAQLLENHERFFKIVREKNPTLPIVIVTRPNGRGTEDTAARFEIIKNTYSKAKAAGDENVYLINGIEFFGELADDCMVDGVHPTDLGFLKMAEGIGKVLAEVLK